MMEDSDSSPFSGKTRGWVIAGGALVVVSLIVVIWHMSRTTTSTLEAYGQKKDGESLTEYIDQHGLDRKKSGLVLKAMEVICKDSLQQGLLFLERAYYAQANGDAWLRENILQQFNDHSLSFTDTKKALARYHEAGTTSTEGYLLKTLLSHADPGRLVQALHDQLSSAVNQKRRDLEIDALRDIVDLFQGTSNDGMLIVQTTRSFLATYDKFQENEKGFEYTESLVNEFYRLGYRILSFGIGDRFDTDEHGRGMYSGFCYSPMAQIVLVADGDELPESPVKRIRISLVVERLGEQAYTQVNGYGVQRTVYQMTYAMVPNGRRYMDAVNRYPARKREMDAARGQFNAAEGRFTASLLATMEGAGSGLDAPSAGYQQASASGSPWDAGGSTSGDRSSDASHARKAPSNDPIVYVDANPDGLRGQYRLSELTNAIASDRQRFGPAPEPKAQMLDLDGNGVDELILTYDHNWDRVMRMIVFAEEGGTYRMKRFFKSARLDAGHKVVLSYRDDEIQTFHACRACNVEMPKPITVAECYAFSGGNFVRSKAPTPLADILANLSFLKAHGVPPLDQRDVDDGTRKAYAECTLAYYFATYDRAETKRVFFENYPGADAKPIWDKIEPLLQ